ncbi:hypothetical protein [Burkholderia sp. BCC0397]|uniref:hypothetical protein n=1 Tax=Burkholderia sp. BCC0397 TaxID=486876 RepID=UPI00158C5394|nr:hypothetical protein [Burkholderia sp. BCC0397]
MDEIIDVDSGMNKHPQRFQNTRLGVDDACGRTPASPACDSASRSASHRMARAHAGQPVSLAAEILAIARHAKRNSGQVARPRVHARQRPEREHVRVRERDLAPAWPNVPLEPVKNDRWKQVDEWSVKRVAAASRHASLRCRTAIEGRRAEAVRRHRLAGSGDETRRAAIRPTAHARSSRYP